MDDWLREYLADYHELCRKAMETPTAMGFVGFLEAVGASPWRSVEDGYPSDVDDTKEYFVHCIADGYTTAAYVDMALWEMLEVTHWMPVPPPPK